jgi:hypothetical protein
MSFLKKLFGGGSGAAPSAPPEETQEHKGYRILAHPVAENGGFRVSGTIVREDASGRREKRFERADRSTSRDEAVDITFQKGRLMIDQLGAAVLD